MVSTARGEEVGSNFDVLIDSDAFVAGILPKDSLHDPATSLWEKIKQAGKQVVATSWVILETATVLSYRDGQALARQFLEQTEQSGLPIIHMTEALQQEATHLFVSQHQRSTSMIDCGNVIVMRRLQIPEIFSFDKFYKRLDLTLTE